MVYMLYNKDICSCEDYYLSLITKIQVFTLILHVCIMHCGLKAKT